MAGEGRRDEGLPYAETCRSQHGAWLSADRRDDEAAYVDGERSHARSQRLPVASVVVPAHNEEAVIGRLLAALADDMAAGSIEVVVACNACTDRTADVARAHGARVVEVSTASKIAALNAGDAAATAFPRLYIDADIALSGQAVLDVARALDQPDVLCAAPPFDVDTAGRRWPVRAYFEMWRRIPYVHDAYVGSGVFAMSAAGRARFEHFPPVIADDLFARNLFSRSERRRVPTRPFVVQAPWTLRALVRRRMRIQAGNAELAAHPVLGRLPGARERSAPWWRPVLARPALLPPAAVYVLVNLAARLAVRRSARRGRAVGWNRDETSRAAPLDSPTPPTVGAPS